MRLFLLLVGLVLFNSVHAESFPVLGEPADTKVYKFGTGTCSTERTGVWLVNKGVVIEVKQPRDCMFKDGMLMLVVGEEKLPLAAVDDAFIVRKFGNGQSEYRWIKTSGRLFFKSDSHNAISANNIKGIIEPTCSDANCLNEISAQSK